MDSLYITQMQRWKPDVLAIKLYLLGSERRARTSNMQIQSLPFYQLNYLRMYVGARWWTRTTDNLCIRQAL